MTKEQCQDCGNYKSDVQTVFDPYASDVDNEAIEITVCDDCLARRSLEI